MRAGPPGERAYCSRTQLAHFRDAAGAFELDLLDGMLLWTPAEAKEYFDSRGCSVPADTSGRSAEDRQTDNGEAAAGARKRKQEALLCVFCPCCDQIIMSAREQPAAPAQASMEREGSAVPRARLGWRKRLLGCSCTRCLCGCLCCSYAG